MRRWGIIPRQQPVPSEDLFRAIFCTRCFKMEATKGDAGRVGDFPSAEQLELGPCRGSGSSGAKANC